TSEDFVLDIKQKGVDMKIGLDIATLANKHHAEKIILITADSDFIPAVKHARKEGIIVQLDPMRIPETQIKKGLL
ncbi:NYN domain-containing protein, partial [Campylobacter coli]